MIDKICDKLMNRIRAKMPEVDDERAEVIRYGIEIIIGEIPKMFILILVAGIMGVLKYTMLAFFLILPYRYFSGGLHLKTHIGCIIGTLIFYIGIVYASQNINYSNMEIKYIFFTTVLILSMITITLYVPADTENLPILKKKERKSRKIISYILVLIMFGSALFIKHNIISNILIISVLFQSITTTKIAYKIFKEKYGYLEYIKLKKDAI